MEIVIIIVVGIIILIGGLWLRQLLFKNAVLKRIKNLEHMAETRKFRQPGENTLDPNVEYMNVSTISESKIFELVIFSVDGIQDERAGLTQAEIQQIVTSSGWIRSADNYRTVPEGLRITSQYERPRKQSQ